MAINSKLIACAVAVFLMSGCSQFNAEFKPPSGMIVTAVKAPLSVKIPDKKIGNPQKRSYLTSFFWIPMVIPSVAFTDTGSDGINGSYADYEYSSILFGMFQSVSIITYD